MAKRIRVRGVDKQEPDVRLYVLALIELARQMQDEEAASGGHKHGHHGGTDGGGALR